MKNDKHRALPEKSLNLPNETPNFPRYATDDGYADRILLSTLQHFQCGGIVCDDLGVITALNDAAFFILDNGSEQRPERESVPEISPPVADELRLLIGRSRAVVQPIGQSTPHRIYRDEKRFLIIYRFPVDLPAGRTLLAIVDMNRSMLPQPQILKLLFDC